MNSCSKFIVTSPNYRKNHSFSPFQKGTKLDWDRIILKKVLLLVPLKHKSICDKTSLRNSAFYSNFQAKINKFSPFRSYQKFTKKFVEKNNVWEIFFEHKYRILMQQVSIIQVFNQTFALWLPLFLKFHLGIGFMLFKK